MAAISPPRVLRQLRVPGAPRRVRNRSQRWCFTINAAPGQSDPLTLDTLEMKAGGLMDQLEPGVFIYQIERGDQGTAHVQGYCEFKYQKDFSYLKRVNKHAHWEKAKGSRAENVKYCTKPEGFLRGPWMKGVRLEPPDDDEKQDPEQVFAAAGFVPFGWQTQVLGIAKAPVHPRRIHWFWEPTGNVGKTFLCRSLVSSGTWFYGACHGRGSGRDVLYGVARFLGRGSEQRERGGRPRPGVPDPEPPRCDGVLVDVPRSVIELDMSIVEQLKNGLFFNGKYESQMIMFDAPHVFIFSNRAPSQAEYGALSRDRWIVYRIDDDKELCLSMFDEFGNYQGETAEGGTEPDVE